ncbi:MAG: abortive infection protein [Oscillatoriales cyanobacterium]|jgi:predicted Abi (CAAX) family protease|uniref:Abortive infection protein n=1 Tax=Microcoleus anatoxicus PTRS2 TaxID=2705321 RepID=A0ABU8YG20_9CYAN|nr:MAG: abortive infection protein [Oscillatoriales cyanobacterium]TAD95815.1 MAG: abortive infection protein [Oscillatoriales cyanobacterium]TAE03452.1 MAG: abortive infection protein [Oscillatoriales cyanobacterium]TAF04085.1 MAG: abortive infection protein [Oscillatoriales cyanobacterium]TAF43162.1 MAG: abortive infection protein [Oscillatoriales cyanobacterium]
MTVSVFALSKTLLLSGQFVNRLFFGIGLIILTVIVSLTAFIFMMIFIKWLQAIFQKYRQYLRPQFGKNISQGEVGIFDENSNVPSLQPGEKLYKNSPAIAHSYHPIALWYGRLILPSKEQREPYGSVFFEVFNAPKKHQKFVGKIVNLKWSTNREVQFFVHGVTQDINFTKDAEDSKKAGNIHPDRLNGLANVGPLETLAGSRLEDNVTVMLRRPAIAIHYSTSDRYELTIDREPVQIIGRWCALISILQRNKPNSDKFIVRHFNKKSQRFDGPAEMIRIPQVKPDKNGVARSTNHLIEKSPLNPEGWYIYGKKGPDNIFVVQAIEPRKITKLIPDETHWGLPKSLDYLNSKNWQNTRQQKGQAKIVLLSSSTEAENDRTSPWEEGDMGIVIHCFGGIGGKKAEFAPLGIVTGHFALGIAKVVRDRFTDELRFDIEYKQVYAHNPDGIIAGASKWQSYMGDLARGWLGDRPVCDIICKLDCVCLDYHFDSIQLSPLDELNQQLDIMMARYRSGDGTGASLVTPATSCVQDSSQAIYATIKKITAEVESNPQIQDWLKTHPTDAQTQRFQELVALGKSLEKILIPLGIVRPDWRKNARLVGIRAHHKKNHFRSITNPLKAAISYRTMLPRRTQDELAKILLKQASFLWIIRTNQVGGFDANIEPVPPTRI